MDANQMAMIHIQIMSIKNIQIAAVLLRLFVVMRTNIPNLVYHTAGNKFLQMMLQEVDYYCNIIRTMFNKPLNMTAADERHFKQA